MQLGIEKLVYGGDGLARLPPDEQGRGKAVFLPFVLEGEKVEAVLLDQKPGFARARAEHILAASAQRIEPRCPYFQSCGGCHYQHTGYEHQLKIKAAILRENLRRLAKLELETQLDIHPSPPWHYRNRTRLQVLSLPDFALGYYRFNSHEVLPVEQCPISSPLINRAIAAVWQLGRAGKVSAAFQEIEFFTNAEDTQLLAEIHGSAEMAGASERFAADFTTLLPEFRGAVFLAARGRKVEARVDSPAVAISGDSHLVYSTRLASYRVSAGSFFQVNRHLAEDLLSIVVGEKGGSPGTALDLYAGVGLFSSVLSGNFERVIAVESSPASHADLLSNSPANVKAVRATTEQYLEHAAGQLRPQLVVVDPPRSGLGDKVVQSLVKLRSPRLIYVSCDPATLCRDLSRLLASGYRVQEAHLVDLFPQTYHVESVFHLVR